MSKTYSINVYLDDGRVFVYDVPSSEKAREHTSAIITTGYRHVTESKSYLEHYPPHRISKVKIVGNIETNYTDKATGT